MASNRAPVRRPKRKGLSRRWWIVALILFLAFDVALIAVALNANRLPAGVANKTPSASAESPTPEPTTTPVPSVAPTAVAPQRLLAAVDGDVAWRGVVGSCPDGPSTLEYTGDGGATWKTTDPALEAGANTLVRAVPASSSEANVVTLDTECSPQLVGTFVSGDAWEDYSANLSSYWYVDPASRGTVHTPGGDIPAPCESVAALATNPSGAAVLCSDQLVYELPTGGSEWSAGVSVPGAVALDGTSDGYLLAVAVQGDCAGVSVTTLSGGVAGAPTGCVGVDVAPGQTAVAATDAGVLWLWAGDNFVRSTDGGTTWG